VTFVFVHPVMNVKAGQLNNNINQILFDSLGLWELPKTNIPECTPIIVDWLLCPNPQRLTSQLDFTHFF